MGDGGCGSKRERMALWLCVRRFAATDKSIRDSSAAWMLEALLIQKGTAGGGADPPLAHFGGCFSMLKNEFMLPLLVFQLQISISSAAPSPDHIRISAAALLEELVLLCRPVNAPLEPLKRDLWITESCKDENGRQTRHLYRIFISSAELLNSTAVCRRDEVT